MRRAPQRRGRRRVEGDASLQRLSPTSPSSPSGLPREPNWFCRARLLQSTPMSGVGAECLVFELLESAAVCGLPRDPSVNVAAHDDSSRRTGAAEEVVFDEDIVFPANLSHALFDQSRPAAG